MSNENEEMVISNVDIDSVEEKASYDIQIATAKKYPRDIQKALNNSILIATMNIETSKSCGYALPRGGKPVQGPSVHLARILLQNWGNVRAEAKIINITHTQIISSAICFDMESNVAVKVEVRRKIISKTGKRFNEDMITMTGNAANAIALRNAVFSVVPRTIVDKVYNATKNMITGDLSTEEKLIKYRASKLKYFKNNYGATEEEILNALGVGSINAIRQDKIIVLDGIDQAIKDGDTTADEVFERNKKKTPKQKKEDLKNKNNTKNTEMP